MSLLVVFKSQDAVFPALDSRQAEIAKHTPSVTAARPEVKLIG